jgi:phosphomannomutase
MRVYAEAPTAAKAQELAEAVIDVVKNVLAK